MSGGQEQKGKEKYIKKKRSEIALDKLINESEFKGEEIMRLRAFP